MFKNLGVKQKLATVLATNFILIAILLETFTYTYTFDREMEKASIPADDVYWADSRKQC